jgi:hypothetical protein
MKKFSSPVIKELKYYVYIYSNPINDEIFYVGKGKGDRIFQHLDEESETHKAKYLKELKSQGIQPKLEILIHGLDEEETALRVESAIIDLIGVKNLTNKQSGYRSAAFGRMTLTQITALYDKQKVDVDDPAILIRINKAFRYSMSEMELYEYTRGKWKLDPKRAQKAKYGIAVFEGIVQEVYEILNWYEAGTTFSLRAENEYNELDVKERWLGRQEFIGNIAPHYIRNKYRFKSVEHYFQRGNANPIMYQNV